MIVDSRAKFEDVLSDLYISELAITDVETSGLAPWKGDRICGVGINLEDNSYYLPFRHGSKDELPLFEMEDVETGNLPIEYMQDLWEVLSKVPVLIGHNIKFDMASMHQDGFRLGKNQRLEDTIIAARLCSSGNHPQLGLDYVANRLLGPGAGSYKSVFQNYLSENNWKDRFDLAPAEIVGKYCCEDLVTTKQIRIKLLQQIKETGQTGIWEKECDLLSGIWGMEKIGIAFDREYCEEYVPKLNSKLKSIEKEIFRLAGREFNISSPAQLNEVFNDLGYYSKSITKIKGDPQWTMAEIMEVDHPISKHILEYGKLEHLRNTYFEPLLAYLDNIVHCTIKTWGTATGRVSVTDPNLQNLTKDSEKKVSDEAMKAMLGARAGKTVILHEELNDTSELEVDEELNLSVRRLYVPREGFHLWMMDFDQMEMRVFADYVQDPVLSAKLEKIGVDFHALVASQIWGVSKGHELYSFYRKIAKYINFGLIFGIGFKKLAAQIQKTVQEAKEYKRKYFEQMPQAEKFISRTAREIQTRGYVTNTMGRRYYLPKERDYVGVNYLVQGLSADIVKLVMVNCMQFLEEMAYKTRLLLQIHDELIFEVAIEEEREVVPALKNIMEERHIKTFLPVEVSKGFPSWGQKETICILCFGIKKKDEVHICSAL